MVERSFDVIVFGADLFQLEKAAAFAADGKKVIVLTKNNFPGGEYAHFRRGRFEFPLQFDPPEKTAGIKALNLPENASGREIALAFDRKIRELGGEIRYKTEVKRIVPGSSVRVELADGVVLRTSQMENLLFQPERFYMENGVEQGSYMALDIPYEVMKRILNERAGLKLLPGRDPETSSLLHLTSKKLSLSIDEHTERDYFWDKDRSAFNHRKFITTLTGFDPEGHILEMDMVTPITLARYLQEGPAEQEDPLQKAGRMLHPSIQFGRVISVVDRGHAKSFTIGPDPERGTKSLAYFRAGQYISIAQKIGENFVCKPYSICSGPGNALGEENTTYTFMIERNPEGFFSVNALDAWEPGTKLILSGPLGYAYHMPERDAKHVAALAGSSGITPFFSMAAAIADGIEDFDLTIFYGSRTADTILLKEELDELAERSQGRVRIVHVLSDEVKEGFEHGFITNELIRRYMPDVDYSIYVCGPPSMYEFLHRELPKLGLPEGRIRFELPGEFGDPAADPKYPADAAGKLFTLTVKDRDVEKLIDCRSDQTLMQAIERSGMLIEADCRSGQCGWCRSRLLSGHVFVPESRDGRLAGDAEYGWVHPCVTYPLSDVKLEIYNH